MRMRSASLVFVTFLLLALGGVTLAQPGPGGPGGPPVPGGDPVLVQFLGLSEAQLQAWRMAFDELKATLDPLFEQQRAAQQQLDSALETATPDPLTVGQAMIAIRGFGDQVRVAHEGLDAKLRGSLTPEQVVKFDAFRAAVRALQAPRPGGPGPGAGAAGGGGNGLGPGASHMRHFGGGAGSCPNASK